MGAAAALVGRRELRGAFAGWAAAVLIVAALIGGILLVPRARPVPRGRVPIAVVTTGAVQGTLRVLGRLEAKSAIRVGSASPGQVVAVAVAAGDRVRRGQILARMDDLEQRRRVTIEGAQLALAQIKEVQAEKRLSELARVYRERSLLPRDLSFEDLQPGELGDAQLAVLATSSQLRAQSEALAIAQDRLGRRVVRSPIDGIVLEQGAQAGETIGASPPGPPLFVVGSEPSALVLRIPLDEGRWPNVRPGAAEFRVRAAGGRSFRGTIRPFSPAPLQGGPARAEVLIDVANADGAMRPGMLALVELPVQSAAGVLRVPASALTRAEGEISTGTVSLVDGAGQARPTPVEVGVVSEAFAEIRGPAVAPGARVLVRP
jgi:RND family efflux transporter MFP subunit